MKKNSINIKLIGHKEPHWQSILNIEKRDNFFEEKKMPHIITPLNADIQSIPERVVILQI